MLNVVTSPYRLHEPAYNVTFQIKNTGKVAGREVRVFLLKSSEKSFQVKLTPHPPSPSFVFVELDPTAIRQPPLVRGGAARAPEGVHGRALGAGAEQTRVDHVDAVRPVRVERRHAVVAAARGHDQAHHRREQSGSEVGWDYPVVSVVKDGPWWASFALLCCDLLCFARRDKHAGRLADLQTARPVGGKR